MSDKASGDVESDRDVVESDAKEAGDTSVPEETFDTENKSSQAVSVSEQGTVSETVDSEMGSKKGEEDEKTEEKAAADSASTVKESSSVEGDDQKKRFVAFCLLEPKMAISVALAPLQNLDAPLEVICSVHLSVFIPCTHLFHFITFYQIMQFYKV